MKNLPLINNTEIILDAIFSNCEDVSMDYLELGIDALVDSKVIEELPIVKTLYALIKFPLTLWNATYMKKLIYFSYYMKDIPKLERIKFVNKAVYEDKDFPEALLITLEKMDHFDKVKLLRNLFRAYGHRDGIDYDTYRRFTYILNQTYISDLYYLRNNISEKYIGDVSAMALSSTGLANKTVYDGGGALVDDEDDDEEPSYEITNLGKLFYKCVFTDEYVIVE